MARQGRRGFTLIEILIAFAIMAVALVTLLRVFGGGLATTARLERSSAVLSLARSTLERVGADIPLVAGQQSGVTPDGMAWVLDIRPAGLIDAQAVPTAQLLPYEVAITVSAAGVSPVTLTTLRLAPQAQPSGAADSDTEPTQPDTP